MDFAFKLSAIKLRKNMHVSVLNNQSNTYMQHAPVVAPVVAPNSKLPKRGFNVVLSKIKQ